MRFIFALIGFQKLINQVKGIFSVDDTAVFGPQVDQLLDLLIKNAFWFGLD